MVDLSFTLGGLSVRSFWTAERTGDGELSLLSI